MVYYYFGPVLYCGIIVQSLKKHCLATEQCIAFTSDGELKNNLQPSQQWLDSTEDLYVAGKSTLHTHTHTHLTLHHYLLLDMDVCLADLHMCGANSYCINSGIYMSIYFHYHYECIHRPWYL